MSERKQGLQRPFSNRTPTSSSQKNLNATMLVDTRGSARSKVSSLLNSTICPTPMLSSLVPQLDPFESECDLTYNDYLQSATKQIILQKSNFYERAKCNDTMEKIREKVLKLRNKEETLVEEIENIEISRGLAKGVDELKAVIQGIEQTVNKDISMRVHYFLEILTAVNNKLYLHNVQPLRSQEEYGKFDSLINAINAVLEKTLNLAGDIDGLDKLACCLRENIAKHEEIIMKSKTISRLEGTVVGSTLEKTSNLLAACKQNI